ncbi:putative acetyltransferase YhhY [Bacillus sp. THAF10]|uniref:GNAT family N-acetyltransferase n=1 Tax=Bacillus sp. THAF10 TaxID=2587848 RepID=UPI0012690E7F|nr:GNAT family protein [Bacillus sp. THAF10]QFT89336.1 putative acetyltransferase YhhY [Bacillus sp. THAF10]
MQDLRMEFTAKDGSTVILRPVEENDAFDIVKAVESIIAAGEYIQKDVPRSVEEEKDFIKEMKAKENMYIGVERNEKVVGIGRVIRGEIRMKRHTGLFRTWLSEEAQGLGIGKKIMDYTDMWCEHHIRKLSLTVFSSNQIAYQLYKKYGFHEEGNQKEQAFINGEYVDEIWMAKFYH